MSAQTNPAATADPWPACACRQVILGAGYDDSADIWSLACMVFELVTGDFLFQPNARGAYSKDEDHLAQMIELLGEVPGEALAGARYADEFFSPEGGLRNIQELNHWPLEQVLREKYFLPAEEVRRGCAGVGGWSAGARCSSCPETLHRVVLGLRIA
jgi:serine/threonine protein kinase